MSEPVVDQSDVERDLDKTRIRIIGARAVWATWARQQAREAMLNANEGSELADADAEWRGLHVIDDAMRRAETELETAIQLLEKITGDETA